MAEQRAAEAFDAAQESSSAESVLAEESISMDAARVEGKCSDEIPQAQEGAEPKSKPQWYKNKLEARRLARVQKAMSEGRELRSYVKSSEEATCSHVTAQADRVIEEIRKTVKEEVSKCVLKRTKPAEKLAESTSEGAPDKSIKKKRKAEEAAKRKKDKEEQAEQRKAQKAKMDETKARLAAVKAELKAQRTAAAEEAKALKVKKASGVDKDAETEKVENAEPKPEAEATRSLLGMFLPTK